MTDIDKAIELLRYFYNMALDVNKKFPGFYHKPAAWALYRAWRVADAMEKQDD